VRAYTYWCVFYSSGPSTPDSLPYAQASAQFAESAFSIQQYGAEVGGRMLDSLNGFFEGLARDSLPARSDITFHYYHLLFSIWPLERGSLQCAVRAHALLFRGRFLSRLRCPKPAILRVTIHQNYYLVGFLPPFLSSPLSERLTSNVRLDFLVPDRVTPLEGDAPLPGRSGP
jgi:hypothetical protein